MPHTSHFNLKNNQKQTISRSISLIVGHLMDAYGALVLANNRWIGFLIFLATMVDINTGLCGLVAGLTAYAVRSLVRLSALGGQADLLSAIYAGLVLGAYYESGWITTTLSAAAGVLVIVLIRIISQKLSSNAATRSLPILGSPFLFSAWLMLAACAGMGASLRSDYLISPEWLHSSISTFVSFAGSIFYVGNPISGFLVLIAMLLSSRALTIFAITGGVLAYGVVILFGEVSPSTLPMAAGFNGALVAMLLGGFLATPSSRTLKVTIAGVLLATALTAALRVIFTSIGLATLSAPCLLTVWLIRSALNSDESAWWVGHWLSAPVKPEESLVRVAQSISRGVSEQSVALNVPFTGELEVSQGVDGAHTHQGQWRYALDFIRCENGVSFRNQGLELTDYYAFDHPLTSPVWGHVLACRDDLADNEPGAIDLLNNWGNFVLIALSTGECVMLAHLRQHSLQVYVGSPVAPGTPLARLGNSGRSTQPHLHLHVQQNGFLGAPTRPFHLSNCFIDNSYSLNTLPNQGQLIRAPQTERSLAQALILPAGGTWTFNDTKDDWTIALKVKLLGETYLESDSGASVSISQAPQLLAFYQRNSVKDFKLDALTLALGLTPLVSGVEKWYDAPSAPLLPMTLWQKIRFWLRHPFGANLFSQYTREWNEVFQNWEQIGEHSVSILGGSINARSKIVLDHNGPMNFNLTVEERSVVKVQLLHWGNLGDYGIPAKRMQSA